MSKIIYIDTTLLSGTGVLEAIVLVSVVSRVNVSVDVVFGTVVLTYVMSRITVVRAVVLGARC